MKNNNALSIANKHVLWANIKAVAKHYKNTDTEAYLKEYALEIVEKHGLKACLECFESLKDQLKYFDKVIKRADLVKTPSVLQSNSAHSSVPSLT